MIVKPLKVGFSLILITSCPYVCERPSKLPNKTPGQTYSKSSYDAPRYDVKIKKISNKQHNVC